MSSIKLWQSWNVQWGWRWMFLAVVVPSLVFTITSILLPESPRWLIDRGRSEQAERTLAKIGGREYARQEVESIRQALRADAVERSSWSDLLQPPARKPLLIAVGLAVLQQWTGVNILFNYAAEVYRNAGYGSSDIFLNIVITGVINLLFTIAAMFLVDTVGRRKLMLGGCLGIGASHLLCAGAYRLHLAGPVVLVLTVAAIACYGATLAPITWVLIAEVFPNKSRARGVSVAVSALWIASFLLTYTFPLMDKALGTGGVFVAYGATCLLGFAFVYRSVPETKGMRLEEM